MALTFRHWMTVAGLGCGCLAVAFLPPKPREPPPGMPTPTMELRERYQVASMLRQAEGELEEARLVLSIDSVLPTVAPHSNTPTVLPVGAVSPADRDSFAAKVARIWPSELTGADSLRIYFVLQGDETNLEWQDKYLLPDRDGHACVALLKTVTWSRDFDDTDLLGTLLRQIGPCLFYWTYGRPGSSIDRWIHGYGLALATRYDLPGTRGDSLVNRNLRDETPWMVYITTGEVLRCLRGDRAGCAQSIVGPATPDTMLEHRIVAAEWFYRLPLGSESSAWLSDVQRAMGATRFSRFWHSSRPVDQAFEEAFGVDLGAWTREWISERYPGLHPGPLPRGRSVAYAGGIMLLLIGLAAVVAERRTAR